MKRRRVKITGIGPVTPAGIGRDEFWKGILEASSFVRPYTKLGDEYGPLVAAAVDRFNVAKYVDRDRLPKGIGRHTQFAAAGSVLAVQDAGLSAKDIDGRSCVVVTGSSLMDFGGISSSTHSVYQKGAAGALPRTIYTTTNANVTETICAVLELTCRTMTLQNSCCSGLDAIAYAMALVARGEADFAICGGTEAPLHRCPLLELRAAGLTPPTVETPERLARPFDLWRTTGVVGEGACMFVLEPEGSPRPGYCYIEAHAFANDEPGSICSGITTAARFALAEARLKPAEVDAINAWGPGHRLIDMGEVAAMEQVFGPRVRELVTSSIKGAVGSALGAAPAIQVAVAALGLRDATISPTTNWARLDPSCALSLSAKARYIEHNVTLVNAHGVGGVNSCMLLRR